MWTRLFPQTLFASRIHLKISPGPLLFPPKSLGLIWSAKSACTTSILWFYAVAGFLKEALAYDSWPHKYRTEVLPKTNRYQTWLLNTDPRKVAWVRVIRDPYKRAVSSFRHVLRYPDDKNCHFREELGLGLSQGTLSFDSFLSSLEALDITACDNHFRQQRHPLEHSIRPARVINADREPLLDALLAFASPAQEVRQLLEDEISRVSSFHHAHRKSNNTDVSKLPFSLPFLAHDWPEYEEFLSPSTRRKIERIYAADFSAYSSFL